MARSNGQLAARRCSVELDRDGELPLHEQIERSMREDIRAGRLAAGAAAALEPRPRRRARDLARGRHRGLRPARRRGLPAHPPGRAGAGGARRAGAGAAGAGALAAAELRLPLPPRRCPTSPASPAIAGCARCAPPGARRRSTRVGYPDPRGVPGCARRSPSTSAASAAPPPTPSRCSSAPASPRASR